MANKTEITAEEFFRNKFKEKYSLTREITMRLEDIDLETSMKWAHEFNKLKLSEQTVKSAEEVQTTNPNKEKYLMCSNLHTKSMQKEWVELWQQIEIWYGDVQKRETAEQLLVRLKRMFTLTYTPPFQPSPLPLEVELEKLKQCLHGVYNLCDADNPSHEHILEVINEVI